MKKTLLILLILLVLFSTSHACTFTRRSEALLADPTESGALAPIIPSSGADTTPVTPVTNEETTEPADTSGPCGETIGPNVPEVTRTRTEKTLATTTTTTTAETTEDVGVGAKSHSSVATARKTTTTATTKKQTTTTAKATTTKKQTTTTANSAASFNGSFEAEVLALINKERAKANLSPLSMNSSLRESARIRSKEIVKVWGHNRPNGSYYTTVIKIKYSAAAENIACGQQTPARVVESWMNSEGHKGNILNPKYKYIGIGCYYDPSACYRYHWTQLFVAP